LGENQGQKNLERRKLSPLVHKGNGDQVRVTSAVVPMGSNAQLKKKSREIGPARRPALYAVKRRGKRNGDGGSAQKRDHLGGPKGFASVTHRQGVSRGGQ